MALFNRSAAVFVAGCITMALSATCSADVFSELGGELGARRAPSRRGRRY